MDQVIHAKQIQDTDAYKNSSPMQQGFLVKRNSRALITHALIVYRNTKYLDKSIGDRNLLVLKELIFNEFKVEAV